MNLPFTLSGKTQLHDFKTQTNNVMLYLVRGIPGVNIYLLKKNLKSFYICLGFYAYWKEFPGFTFNKFLLVLTGIINNRD